MLLYIVLFAAGIILLSYSSDVLIDKSAILGMRLNIRPFVIGMTVVAFGTSLPEFVVSFRAVLYNTRDIAFGNVVGSNISNIGLILGISAILMPMTVDRRTLRREIPFLIASSFLFYVLCLRRTLDLPAGIVMLAVFALFIYLTVTGKQLSESMTDKEKEEISQAKNVPLLKILTFIFLGLLGVIYGSKLALDNAIKIAEALGVSQLIIGLSVVAIGTSLPELATSVAAILKKKPDMALGNIVGSNIFNIFFILGFAVIFKPLDISGISLVFELPVMLFFTVFIYLASVRNRFLHRISGFVLLAGFITFLLLLFI